MTKKIEVTIKKTSSDEPNVSKRAIAYDVYHNGKYHTTFKDVNDAMDHKEAVEKGVKEDLDEAVLSLLQRQKRAQIIRRNKAKLERAREIARSKLAPEKNIRRRAYKQARQILRTRVAGKRGAEYEKLGPSEKINIDRAIEKKQKLINKLAQRLIPRVKQAEQKRLQAFYAGRGGLNNYGAPEAKHPPVNEAVNNKFAKQFNDDPNADANGEQSRDKPVITNKKDKSSPVVMYSRFEDNGKKSKFAKEAQQESAIFHAILKKSDQSGIDIEILGEVYDRGYFGWNGGRGDPEQAAFARVNSYINQGKSYFKEDADLHEMGGDQHYGDTKGAFSKGAKGTPITSDKMKKNTSKTLNKMFQKAMKKEEVEIEESRAPGNAYVKRANEGGRDILISSTKWGKKKYWRDSVGGHRKAHEHAGLTPAQTGVKATTTEETILEAKATMCGRCGTKHVPASKGGRCPAMKEHTGVDKITESMGNIYIKKSEASHQTDTTIWPDSDRPQKLQTLYHRTEGEVKNHIKSLKKKYGASNVDIKVTKLKEEVQQTNENFMDGKGPGKPGDSARHGLKGKSASELRKIRSSETASPRKKQLAHWMLNMHHNEETQIDEAGSKYNIPMARSGPKTSTTRTFGSVLDEVDVPVKHLDRARNIWKKTKDVNAVKKFVSSMNVKEGLDEAGLWDNIHAKRRRIKAGSGERMRKPGSKGAPTAQDFKDASESYVNEEERPDPKVKVEGTNCRNCVYWRKDLEKPVTKEELNPNGGLKAPNKEYVAMCKRIDLGTLPGKDSSVKVKGFCDHDMIKDWVTERMCCSQWDADGMIRDYKGQSPVMKEEGESIVPQVTSKGSRIRKKIEVVDRAKPYNEYTRQAEVKTKIIDENHPNCGTPDCCGQCETAVGNSQNDSGKRLVGTNSLVKAYKKDTPGQRLNESFSIAYAAGVGQTYTAADLGMKMQGAFQYHPSVLPESSSATQADKKPTTRGGYYNDEGEYVPLKATARRPGKRIIKNKSERDDADGEEQ